MNIQRALSLLALAASVSLLAPDVTAQQTGSTTGSSQLSGKVLGVDGKTPVAGSKVLAYHLSTEQVFSSALTGSKGEYLLRDLPYGYFDLAVETPDGLFVGNQVINLPPASKASVVFTVSPFGAMTADSGARQFPGSQQQTSGAVRVKERLRGRDFWRSPRGVAILAGSGGAALLAIASGGSDSNTPAASPSTP